MIEFISIESILGVIFSADVNLFKNISNPSYTTFYFTRIVRNLGQSIFDVLGGRRPSALELM